MEKNYEITAYESGDEEFEADNTIMLRYYCFLNRCGRRLVKSSSFQLGALLPLVLTRVGSQTGPLSLTTRDCAEKMHSSILSSMDLSP